jgi:two-component system response regulator WspF
MTCEGKLLVIGASAGGPAALVKILSALPADLPAAVVIIQHIDEEFAIGMAEWLGHQSALPVRVALEGDRPEPGTVLLAATQEHLALNSDGALGYTPNPTDYPYRPSVDVFFQSVCKYWRGGGVGVLLTGMGRDGAIGLKALRSNGWHTIAQDRTSSAVYGMPKAAAALNAAVEILAIEKIAPALASILRKL